MSSDFEPVFFEEPITGPVFPPSSGDDQPAEDLPAEDQPVEDLPAEDQPAEDLPSEDQPVEVLPVSDSPVGGFFSGDFGSDSGVSFSIPDDMHITLTLDEPDTPDPAALTNGDAIPYALLDPITAADSTGLKAVVLSVIGDYQSIVTEYRYQNSGSSTYQYLRQVSPDYPWLMSAALFIVLVISVFRIAGGFLWKR